MGSSGSLHSATGRLQGAAASSPPLGGCLLSSRALRKGVVKGAVKVLDMISNSLHFSEVIL